MAHAAAHAARVVGDHPADRREVGGRRVGAHAALVPGERPVHAAEHRAGPDAHPRAVVEHRDAREVAPYVHEDPGALALAVEAGAAGAQRHRDAQAAAERERRSHIVRVTRHHHRLRDQAVGAGVGRVADEVEDAGEHLLLAQLGDEL